LTRAEFRKLRLSLGMTQTDLASFFGMSRNTITRWEAGLIPFPKIAAWAIKGLVAERRVVSRGRRR
jgi:transcriptional regulator with XRE-family HTH domain